jgi:hypothetical protein
VYDATFSHIYSFTAIVAFVVLTERWWAEPTINRSVALGAIAALIVLIRHTNAIFLLTVPLYGITRWREFPPRLATLWARRSRLLMTVAVAFVGVLPQLAIYRAATGAWIVGPYRGLDIGFTWLSPHIVGVLFSTQKGLFFWSPALLMAVAGVVIAARTRCWARSLVVPAVVILAIDTYLIASWADWQFGGSFGHRAFTDGLGVFAIFLAAFFEWTMIRPRLAAVVALVTTAAVALSVAQMIQYWMGILPFMDTTWAQYQSLFLKFR